MEGYLSLKDHVYNYISQRINSGEMKPGDKISEIQVSEEMHVSRTPVREALMQLASDGYLENLPRKGFRVKTLDIETVRQLYEIIGTLDGRAAHMCVELLTETELAEMQFLAESMSSAINAGLGDKYYELQVEFHDVYLHRCPNQELQRLLKQLKNNFIRKYYLFEDPENENEVLKDTNSQHFEIIRLFREKKADELEAYIRDIHWNSKKAIFDAFPK